MIGLAAVVGLPVLHNLQEARRLESAAHELHTRVHFAKSRAAEMNQIVRIDFAPDPFTPADRFYAIYVDLNRNGALDPGEVDSIRPLRPVSKGGLRGYELPEALSFGPPAGAANGPLGVPVDADGVALADDQVAFYPDGMTSQAGHVCITDAEGRGYAVTVSAGGATRVYGFDRNATQWK